MSPRRFDTFLIVDWSAANAPKRGRDSIWIAEADSRGAISTPINPPTRAEAMAHVSARLAALAADGKRIFAGFDFPFGYPAGAATRIAGAPHWAALWRFFAERVADDEANRSNRYALAEAINRDAFGAPVYWGHPHQHRFADLPPRRPDNETFRALEFRLAERAQRPAKSVWQLAYAGAAGSQAMLGMAHLQRLRARFGKSLAVWPFETRFAEDLTAPIVVAEIYPSMVEVRPREGEVKDCAQVRCVAAHFAALDRAGKFADMLARPPGLSDADAARVLAEEGWIVGAGRNGI